MNSDLLSGQDQAQRLESGQELELELVLESRLRLGVELGLRVESGWSWDWSRDWGFPVVGSGSVSGARR